MEPRALLIVLAQKVNSCVITATCAAPQVNVSDEDAPQALWGAGVRFAVVPGALWGVPNGVGWPREGQVLAGEAMLILLLMH